jgi:hypothetical protein
MNPKVVRSSHRPKRWHGRVPAHMHGLSDAGVS